MRTLEFPSIETYECMYEGLLVARVVGPDVRTMQRVLSKLESVGHEKQEGKFLHTLVDTTPIKFEDSEYELVKRALNGVEFNGFASRKVGPMMEWLEEIKRDET